MDKCVYDKAIEALEEYFLPQTGIVQKRISGTLNRELWLYTQKWPNELFKRACRHITETFKPTYNKDFPRKADFEEAKKVAYKYMPKKEPNYNVPERELCKYEELNGYFACLKLIHTATKRRVEFNGKPLAFNAECCPPMDIYHWNQNGQPSTWSPLLDEFIRGMYVTMTHNSNLTGYFNGWVEILENMLSGVRK